MPGAVYLVLGAHVGIRYLQYSSLCNMKVAMHQALCTNHLDWIFVL